MLPTFKQQILSKGKDILKKSFASSALQTDLLVGFINQVQNSMEKKGQKIEGYAFSLEFIKSHSLQLGNYNYCLVIVCSVFSPNPPSLPSRFLSCFPITESVF
jgi:hypothetical protein